MDIRLLRNIYLVAMYAQLRRRQLRIGNRVMFVSRSISLDILPARFLPPPLLYRRAATGIEIAPIDNESGHFGSLLKRLALSKIEVASDFQVLPFDYYCSSVQDQLARRICKKCGLYFPSQVALKNHGVIHGMLAAQDIDAADVSLPVHSRGRITEIPVFDNIFDKFLSPFADA